MENPSYENENHMNGLRDGLECLNIVDEINDVNLCSKQTIEENVGSHNKSTVEPEMIIETRKKRRKKRDCKHCSKNRDKNINEEIKIINKNTEFKDKISLNYKDSNPCSVFTIDNNEECQGIEMYWSRMMKINSIYADDTKKIKEVIYKKKKILWFFNETKKYFSQYFVFFFGLFLQNISYTSSIKSQNSPSDIHKIDKNELKASRIQPEMPGSCLTKPPIITLAILSLLAIGAFALYIVFGKFQYIKPFFFFFFLVIIYINKIYFRARKSSDD